MRRGSVVIEGLTGWEVISGKARHDFSLPHRLYVEYDDGGTFSSHVPCSSEEYRNEFPTFAKAFGCINCKEIIVVSDQGMAVKIGFTRVDEYERQVRNLIKEGLWIGGI